MKLMAFMNSRKSLFLRMNEFSLLPSVCLCTKCVCVCMRVFGNDTIFPVVATCRSTKSHFSMNLTEVTTPIVTQHSQDGWWVGKGKAVGQRFVVLLYFANENYISFFRDALYLGEEWKLKIFKCGYHLPLVESAQRVEFSNHCG